MKVTRKMFDSMNLTIFIVVSHSSVLGKERIHMHTHTHTHPNLHSFLCAHGIWVFCEHMKVTYGHAAAPP